MRNRERYEDAFQKRERRWDLIETLFYVAAFLLAVVLIVICHALTDSIPFPAYEPGIRYPLTLELK